MRAVRMPSVCRAGFAQADMPGTGGVNGKAGAGLDPAPEDGWNGAMGQLAGTTTVQTVSNASRWL